MKAVHINKSVTVYWYLVPTYPETGYGYINYEGIVNYSKFVRNRILIQLRSILIVNNTYGIVVTLFSIESS